MSGSAPTAGVAAGRVPDVETRLSNVQLPLIALACAVCVANNYYSQPLIKEIARDIGVPLSASGLAPTLTQAGIASGMLLLLPLGDRIDNRRIVALLLKLQAVALAVMAWTSSAGLFFPAAFAAGMCGIVTYLLPAYATRLVAPERKGAVTGFLATGIMMGIMLGRSLAGIAGYAVGWRTLYLAAAVATALMAYVMQRAMPPTPGLRQESYRSLLVSLGRLLRTTPLLRRAALLQVLSFGVFNALWVGLALRLQAPPFGLDTRQIGILSLVAVTGAIAATFLGRMADRYSMSVAVRTSFALIAFGWAGMLALPTSYVGIVAGMVFVGIGATGSDVALRAALYGLAPDIRMRLNSVYSTATFAGGSLFSFAAPLLFTHFGWASVCWSALGVSLIGLLLARPPAKG